LNANQVLKNTFVEAVGFVAIRQGTLLEPSNTANQTALLLLSHCTLRIMNGSEYYVTDINQILTDEKNLFFAIIACLIDLYVSRPTYMQIIN
jgi:hypothetical protein